MKHRMQITQGRSEYDLMANSMKFMQQTTSTLQRCQKVTLVFATNTYCSTPILDQ